MQRSISRLDMRPEGQTQPSHSSVLRWWRSRPQRNPEYQLGREGKYRACSHYHESDCDRGHGNEHGQVLMALGVWSRVRLSSQWGGGHGHDCVPRVHGYDVRALRVHDVYEGNDHDDRGEGGHALHANAPSDHAHHVSVRGEHDRRLSYQ